MSGSAPRIFGIPATRAPVVAVIRRGPTDWYQVGRWDLAAPSFEPGAWLHGTIYPQKCDLSPDGRWLAYSAHKYPGDWPAGPIYEAISRLPWLTALVAWEAGTTYTRGIHFEDAAGRSQLGAPDVGDVGPCLARYGLSLYRPIQFAVERRRGWEEVAGTQPREAGGPWDEQRRVVMEKRRPGGGPVLEVEGTYAAFRNLPDQRDPAVYSTRDGTNVEVLDGVQWADWDAAGRLVVATTGGRLQIRDQSATVFEENLARFEPAAVAPPQWATEW